MWRGTQSSGLKMTLGGLGLMNKNNLVESWVSDFRLNTNLNSARFNRHQPQV